MWPFKKKKIYQVETETAILQDRLTFIVKAVDKADAWKKATRQSNYYLGRCLSITELKEEDEYENHFRQS